GGNFPDELFLAQYYVAMCYYQLRNYRQSLKEALKATILDDRWAETYCCIGECYYFLGDYKKAVAFLSIASDIPVPKTGMFVRREMYGPVPRYWLSCSYEKLGDLDKAKEYAKGDENRERQLANRKTVIEMHRPGALGDVLATTPAIRELRKQNPDALLRYVTHQSSVDMLKFNPDIDEIVNVGGEWDRHISFDYPMKEGYPNTPMTKHLSHYFADCADVELPDDWKPILEFGPGDIVKLEHKKPIITFAVRTGWSRYKEWPLERWAQLIERFEDYQFIQLGAPGETEIEGAQYMCGKLTLRQSFCVLEQSALFIGLDSVFQHVAAALEVPAVVMFGSTSPQGSGYDGQINLASGDDCQPCYREDNTKAVHKKPPCPYSHKCMIDYMTVDRVAEAVNQKLKVACVAYKNT
ncbi:MAG: glycosyltransferase family 9 protein, partial [Planctomycetota bacterium]